MRRSLVVLGLLAAMGCGPKSIDIAVNVITTVCDPDLDPFNGVNFVQLRVSGTGLDTPLFSNAVRTSGQIVVPEIPAGLARVIELRGYSEDPASSPTRPISIGRSLPFDVPDVVTDTNRNVAVNVFLRKVDSFTPPSTALTPGQCSRMRQPRAGHTATLLKDGRVFIAGGYRLDGTTQTAQAEAELYDPATGAFIDAPKMALSNGLLAIQKAFHTATLLNNGQVLLYGGELYTNGANNVVIPQTSVLIFDADRQQYGAIPPRKSPSPLNIARSHHLAVTDGQGRVLIAGGLTRKNNDLVPTTEVEWFDPATNQVNVIEGDSLPRVDASAASVQNGTLVVIAGGGDGTALLGDAVFYQFDAALGSFVRQSKRQLLKRPRRAAGAAAIVDTNDLLMVGGYTDPVAIKPDSTSEVVKTRDDMVDFGPSVGSRGDVCTALMPGGRVLAVGGRTVDVEGMPPRSDGTAVVIAADGTTGQVTAGAAAALKVPRWAHTCTTLSDGTVLVTGGIGESSGAPQTVLQDAWVYTPIPPP